MVGVFYDWIAFWVNHRGWFDFVRNLAVKVISPNGPIKGVENGDISKVDIIYSLNEVDTGRVVAKGQVNAKKALSARFYELSFDTIKNCKGKAFVLSIN